MDFGNVFFAGSGANSRDDQMVIALCDEAGCKETGLGHADWEVSLGTIRPEGWAVLEAIQDSGRPYPKLEMPGMVPGSAGPDQGKFRRDPHYLRDNFPDLEYFRQCTIVQRDVELRIPRPRDALRNEKVKTSNAVIAKASAPPQLPTHMIMGLANLVGGAEGTVHFELLPHYSPIGVRRLTELIEANFFTRSKFFRVGENFVAQFGLAADPAANGHWHESAVLDDKPGELRFHNVPGTISFASSGPNSRTTQLFINLGDNSFLDDQVTPSTRVIH